MSEQRPVDDEAPDLIEYSSPWSGRRSKIVAMTAATLLAVLVCGWITIRVSVTSGDSEPAKELVFAAVGDWGYQGGSHETTVADAMARWCLVQGCHFALSTGDNFYPAGVQSASDEQFRLSFEQVFNGTGLAHVPFLVSVGNHDYYGDVEAQLAYARSHPRWVFPSRYYARHWPASDFKLRLIALDTTPLVRSYANSSLVNQDDYAAQDPLAQQAWLAALLANRSPDTVDVVFGHHPVVTPVQGIQDEVLPPELARLLVSHRVPLVLSGHVHNLEHLWFNGQDVPQYVVSGGGGKIWATAAPAANATCQHWMVNANGFVGVRVNSQRINVQFWSDSSVLLREFNVFLNDRSP